jgi:DNA-binding response OmpR family regulator
MSISCWCSSPQPARPSTDEILNELRGIDAQLFSRSVDILVSRLRQKLKDTSRQPRFIKTVWGTGYAFIGEEVQPS